jgi:hypothetical protein
MPLIVAALPASFPAVAKASDFCRPDVLDREDLERFAGRYEVVGRDYWSGRAFTGVARFSLSDALDVQWQGAGITVSGRARTEKCAADNIPVLRIAFRQRGVDMDGECHVGSELDNYPRITCVILRRDHTNTRHGLLAFFFHHAAGPAEDLGRK